MAAIRSPRGRSPRRLPAELVEPVASAGDALGVPPALDGRPQLASSVASSRSVGIAPIAGQVAEAAGAGGSAVHGARNVSRPARIAGTGATRAPRPDAASPAGTRCAGGPDRRRPDVAATCAATAATCAAIRSSHRRAAATRGRPRVVARIPGRAAGADRRRRRRCRRVPRAHAQRVAKPVEALPVQDPVVGQRQQARPQRQQVAGEVAAVHRRDVERRQRLQRLRVVPVVEVALGSAPARSSCAACSPCARRAGRPGCSRSRRRSGSPAARAPCWSATCDARPRRPDAPGSCRAAASGPPGRRRSRRTPRSCARACAGSGSGPRLRRASRRASGRLIHQAIAGDDAARAAGSARPPASAGGAASARWTAAATAMAGAIHIERIDAASAVPTDSSARSARLVRRRRVPLEQPPVR